MSRFFSSNRMCSSIAFRPKLRAERIGNKDLIFYLINDHSPSFKATAVDSVNHFAFRASDWKLDEPDWTGRLRLVVKGNQCTLNIEDKQSGQLFAKCFIDQYPGMQTVEFVFFV